MTYQIFDPVDIPHLHQILNALQAEIDERRQMTVAPARNNVRAIRQVHRGEPSLHPTIARKK